ncbi:hypothetical protein JL09_g6955 [Pichia kudriavzevii]|uniref:Uncharacterized protein n=1 Tax=Pichia kudriavzevii TaxID=4909 RepID=A0A099NID2_PICKU|nr:hypothetical protein JL09_g6955 [Pichia kudriavzevii]
MNAILNLISADLILFDFI